MKPGGASPFRLLVIIVATLALALALFPFCLARELRRDRALPDRGGR